MKLSEVLPCFIKSIIADLEISRITQDSRTVNAGAVFFAIEGSKDGHHFIEQAFNSGAIAAVIRKGHPEEKKWMGDPRVVAVANPRRTLAEAACAFYGYPSLNLWVCGVTGTNGKTTSTHLLEAILEEQGKPCAVIGTIETRFRENRIASSHTTPDAVALQSQFEFFKKHGAQAVAMEVSSHALDQERVWGTHFEAVLFTNLTQDHLDYHVSMEEYFKAKSKLFLEHPSRVRAIHVESPWGLQLKESCEKKGLQVITYGKHGCHVNYGDLRISASGIRGKMKLALPGSNASIEIRSSLIGAFNAQNIAGAVAVGLGLGVPTQAVSDAIAKTKPVPGRMERVPNSKGVTVVVDYAHTPDALENALCALKLLCLPGKKLVCVFGCGGDRDPGKRPLMGAAAEKLADIVIVTSDNPRTENPDAIIKAILEGMSDKSKAQVEPDRKKAIAQAIKLLKAGDILLIAGKGHENYQILGNSKLPFDDRGVALENLRND